MSQGGAPLREHVISLVLSTVPGPTWALHDEPLPTVVEQFDALMQGEELSSRDMAQAFNANGAHSRIRGPDI